MGPKQLSTEKAETPNKRPTRNYKKKEERIDSSSDGPNGLLNNTNDTNIPPSKNTRPKRTYTKRQKETVLSPPNELPNNPQTKKKRGPKKKIASAPSSQIINELLKDDNGPPDNENGHKDDEVLNEDFNDDDPNEDGHEDGPEDPEDDGSEPKDDDNRSSQMQQNTQLDDNRSSRPQQNSQLNKKDQEYDLSEESEDDKSFYEAMSQGLKNSSSITQAKGMNSQSNVQPNRTMSSRTS